MSAYITNPEHLGILAAYAVQNRCTVYEWRKNDLIHDAQTVAKNLAKENIRSVATRYPNDKDGERPGPCLKDAEILEAAAIYAAHFVTHPQQLTPVQVLKLCQCLAYQSCETEDWTTTLAWRQLEWIKSDVIHKLPGYDDADWEFTQAIPAIEALYGEVK